MIDTVGFTIKGERISENKVKDLKRTGGGCFNGNVRNLRVWQGIEGVAVEGSVAKFLRGHNLTGDDGKDVKAFIKKFLRETGLDASGAVVKRVDYAVTVVVEHPTAIYFGCLGAHPRKQRVERSAVGSEKVESVGYMTRTGGEQCHVYDKGKEAERRNQQKPELFAQGKNILRLEYRIVNRQGVKRWLGNGADVTLGQLADGKLIHKLMERFEGFYREIEKRRTVFVPRGEPMTASEVWDFMAVSYMQLHPEEYRAIVGCVEMDKQNRSRLRKREREAGNNYTITRDMDVIHELDGKLAVRGLYHG